jgi:hypothetical protein
VETIPLSDVGAGAETEAGTEAGTETEEVEDTKLDELLAVTVFSDIYTVF